MPRRPTDPPRYPPPGNSWLLPTRTAHAGDLFFRLTRLRHPDPVFYGCKGTERFDSPDLSYGVCYLGTSLDTCFVEVLHPDPCPGGFELPTISLSDLTTYYASVVQINRDLVLAELAGDGLPRLSIDLRVTCGDDYGLSQAWSGAIYGHRDHVDGIHYNCRHRDGLYSVALFDRAASAVTFTKLGPLGDRGVPRLWTETNRILDQFGILLVP